MACDAVDMVVVHRVFRREFHDVPALVSAVPAGDSARAHVVGDHIKFMADALRHHHGSEDDQVWPKLTLRAPAQQAAVSQLIDDHTEIAVLMKRVESLVARWMASAEPALREQLSDASRNLSTSVDRHLDDEERYALPIIEQHLTQKEWAAAVKQAASFISVRNLRLGIVLGGLVLDAASEAQRHKILSGAPLPQRLVVQFLGPRSLAAYRRRLYRAPN